jgi:ABC-type sugar transport system ATPase subunit
MPSPADTPQTQPSQPKQLLRLIPLDDTVVFPNMGITLTIDVGDDERVVLVPRHENEFLEVGTIAEVTEHIRLPGGGRAVAISGEHRALIGAAQTGPTGELRVEVDERPDAEPVDGHTRELEREYRAVVEEILELRGDDGRIAAFLGAEHLLALRPRDLDAAERVRVALARAIVRRPRLLVIDEPTIGVDLLARDGILSLLRSLADEGTAVLTSTADAAGLESADRALTLSDGELTGSAAPDRAAVIPLRRASNL